MKKTLTVLSLGYWWSAYTLGLLLHPYKTVRELRRKREFGPMVITPVVLWAGAWIVGMVALRFGHIILVILGLVATGRFVNILAFLFWWVTYFLALWQIVIGYLWVRFGVVADN